MQNVKRTDNLFGPLEVVRPERQEEYGQVQAFQKHDICVIFEHIPVWLFCLKPSFIKTIYLNECRSFDHFYSKLKEYKIVKSLLSHVISNLDKKCFCFANPPPHVLYLISGSITFLNDLPPWLRQKKGSISLNNIQEHGATSLNHILFAKGFLTPKLEDAPPLKPYIAIFLINMFQN